jgi:hypothetical protein
METNNCATECFALPRRPTELCPVNGGQKRDPFGASHADCAYILGQFEVWPLTLSIIIDSLWQKNTFSPIKFSYISLTIKTEMEKQLIRYCTQHPFCQYPLQCLYRIFTKVRKNFTKTL